MSGLIRSPENSHRVPHHSTPFTTQIFTRHSWVGHESTCDQSARFCCVVWTILWYFANRIDTLDYFVVSVNHSLQRSENTERYLEGKIQIGGTFPSGSPGFGKVYCWHSGHRRGLSDPNCDGKIQCPTFCKCEQIASSLTLNLEKKVLICLAGVLLGFQFVDDKSSSRSWFAFKVFISGRKFLNVSSNTEWFYLTFCIHQTVPQRHYHFFGPG